jgi:hypothetical protein
MLSRDLERYVDGKRSLGFKFRSQSVQLRSFVAFAESRGDRYVRSARVLAWAGKAPSPQHRRSRLLLVRRFALALHAENARHQIPGTEALEHATIERRSPYIYAPGEITRLLQARGAPACRGRSARLSAARAKTDIRRTPSPGAGWRA